MLVTTIKHGKDKLSLLKFTLRIAKCDSSGQSATFLQFARGLRTFKDVKHDIKAVIEKDNFVPESPSIFERFGENYITRTRNSQLHQDKQK